MDLYMVFKELDFCRLGGFRLSRFLPILAILPTSQNSKIYFLVNIGSGPYPLPIHPRSSHFGVELSHPPWRWVHAWLAAYSGKQIANCTIW